MRFTGRCECGGDSCANMSYCLTFQEDRVTRKLCNLKSPQSLLNHISSTPSRDPSETTPFDLETSGEEAPRVPKKQISKSHLSVFHAIDALFTTRSCDSSYFFLQCSYAASLPKKDGKSHLVLLKLLPHPLYKKSEPSLDN